MRVCVYKSVDDVRLCLQMEYGRGIHWQGKKSLFYGYNFCDFFLWTSVVPVNAILINKNHNNWTFFIYNVVHYDGMVFFFHFICHTSFELLDYTKCGLVNSFSAQLIRNNGSSATAFSQSMNHFSIEKAFRYFFLAFVF